jgi:hypothetical protein
VKPIRSFLSAALILALLGLLAGCGGGSSSSSSSTTASTPEPAPSEAPAEAEGEGEAEPGGEPEAEAEATGPKAAVVKEGDAICLATDEVTAQLQAEFKKVNEPSAPDFEKKLSELLVRIVVIGRTEGEELSGLEPPKGDAPTIERWIATGQEGLSQFEAAAKALKSEGQSPKFSKLYEEGQATLTKANEIAGNYGFKVCGGARAF